MSFSYHSIHIIDQINPFDHFLSIPLHVRYIDARLHLPPTHRLWEGVGDDGSRLHGTGHHGVQARHAAGDLGVPPMAGAAQGDHQFHPPLPEPADLLTDGGNFRTDRHAAGVQQLLLGREGGVSAGTRMDLGVVSGVFILGELVLSDNVIKKYIL